MRGTSDRVSNGIMLPVVGPFSWDFPRFSPYWLAFSFSLIFLFLLDYLIFISESC